MLKRSLICLAVSALLAGCGGGGGGSVSPSAPSNGGALSTPAPAAPKAATQQITIHLKINPSASATSSNKRHAQYVSSATDGVLVQVYTSPESANPTPIGVSATDVSPGSAACGGATGTRTCTIYIPAPPGTDDFVFTTYDQPPIAGTTTFPANANILSIGDVTQTITLAGTNTVNAALGGVIASITMTPSAMSVPGNVATSYTLAITAFDADNNAIIAGSSDPYNNPITINVSTLTQGSDDALLTLGGPTGTGSGSVTLLQSTQTVTVLYDGLAPSGYTAFFSTNSQGVPSATAVLTPFFVTSTSPYYTAATASLAFSAPGQTSTINLAEYGFAGTFTATPGASCAGVATVSTPPPPSSNASSAVVTAGANAGTCTITFSDGTVSVPLTVTGQYTSSTITIPGSLQGSVSTFAGTAGVIGSADGQGANASFYYPWGVATDAAGNVYVVDQENSTIRKITPGGYVSTFAGSAGNFGHADGQGTAASFSAPSGDAIDSAGNIYVADTNSNTIRKITPGGYVSTLAGTWNVSGHADGQGANASFFVPTDLAVDAQGNIYVTDNGNEVIRKITPGGYVSTLAGTRGAVGHADGQGTAASFNSPIGIAVDAAGNIYVSDYNNSTIRKITPGGYVSTFAGRTGVLGSADGQGTSATFNFPGDVAVDGAGNVYVADTFNCTIRKITPGGTVSTVAGSPGVIGSSDGTGTAASFYYPVGIALDSFGNAYVADELNSTIRKIR